MLYYVFLIGSLFLAEELEPKAEMTIVDSQGQTIVDEVGPGVQVVISSEKSVHDAVAGSIRWRIEGTSQVHIYPDQSTVVLTTELSPGTIRIQQIVAKGGKSDDQTIILKSGKGPQPPPEPTPQPQPDIIPTGLRILIVYENNSNLSREQLNILNSTQLISLLNEKCVKVESRSEWRKWDKSSILATGLKHESKIWQQLWEDTKSKLTALPQIVVATDQKVTVYPLPATEAETISLVRKVSGEK